MSGGLIGLALVAVALAYGRGLLALWRAAGRGRVIAGRQAVAFLAGIAAVAVALVPLEAQAGRLLWLHMVQHLLLTLVAAPLLVLGAPGAALAAALGTAMGAARNDRPGAARGWRARPPRPPRRLRRLASRGWWPLAAAAVHLVVLWGWHVPALYEGALAHPPLHAAEHATMLGSALWLWSAILSHGGPLRRPRPAGALAVFAVATLSVGLGALLALSPAAWYAVYAGASGLSPLEDQQVAGALMWAAGGIVYTFAGATVFAVWLFREGDAHAQGTR